MTQQAQQKKGSSGNSGGSVIAKQRRRRSKLMMWLYIIPALAYLWDKAYIDTLVVMFFEFMDDDPTMWPVAEYVESGQFVLLILIVLACSGFGVYNSLQEE
ncbi:MAG: hypothetical protein V3S69_05775 [Dehalococcoidales bacterium]